MSPSDIRRVDDFMYTDMDNFEQVAVRWNEKEEWKENAI